MNNRINVPSRITGKDVEHIANKLYDALMEAHLDLKGFRLDYVIIDTNMSQPKREKRELEVNSKNTFVEAFLQYHNEGRCLIDSQSFENEIGNIATYSPSELDIYYKLNGQYHYQYYSIPKGIENTNAFFSGFKYHRSLIKRFLVNNRLMKSLRTYILGNYPSIESFLKQVLLRSNGYINKVAMDPFYITIQQKTKKT